MKDLEKVQKTLSEVVDYLKGNNLQLVGEQLLTDVGEAQGIVENLAIHGVVKSSYCEDGHHEVMKDNGYCGICNKKIGCVV